MLVFSRTVGWADAYLLVAASAAAGLILWAGRGESFFADDWSFIVGRYDWTPDAFLLPHNEHPVLVSATLYKLLFLTVGLGAYWPYRVLMLAAHLACVALVFRMVRRRVGGGPAAGAATLVLVFGSSWEMLLFPFALNLLGSVLFGLLAFDLLERNGRRAHGFTCLALAGSVFSSAAGVALAVGVAGELVARRAWRALWVAGIPLAMFAAWWCAYGRAATGRDHMSSHLAGAPAAAYQLMQQAVGSALPLPTGAVGRVTALALALVALCLVRRPQVRTARLVGVTAAAGAFWGMTALGRDGSMGEHRYAYFGLVFLLLAVAELARGVRIDARVGLILCAVLALSIPKQVHALLDGGAYLRTEGTTQGAELAAFETVRGRVAPDFLPEPGYPAIEAGLYFDAVDRFGSPAAPMTALTGQAPEAPREAADRLLLRAVPATLRRAPAETCRVPARRSVVPAAGGTVILRTSTTATVSIRRFASRFSRIGLALPSRGTWVLAIPGVRGPGQWHVQVSGPAAICVWHGASTPSGNRARHPTFAAPAAA